MVAAGPDRLRDLSLLVVERRVREQRRHADDGVHGRPDLVAHVGEELRLGLGGRLGHRFGVLELGLGPLSLDELTDLPTHGFEHAEHVLVGVSDLRAEEFHHSQEPARAHDGEAKGAVKAVLGGGDGAREVRILDDIGDPGGSDSAPHATGQADAGRKGDAPVHLHELLDPPGRMRPDLGAAEHIRVRINGPARTHHPVQAFAHLLKDPGHRLLDGPRLDQDPCRCVLGGQPAFAQLATTIGSVERSGGDRDQRGEEDDIGHHRDGQAELGAEEPGSLADEPQPAQQGRDEDRGGQQAAGQDAPRVGAGHDRHKPPVRSSAGDTETEGEERDRGGKRHGNVAGETIELTDVVRISQHRRQGDGGRDEGEELRRTVSGASFPVEQQQCRADEQEVQPGIGRDPVGAEPLSIHDLVEAEVVADQIADQRGPADDDDEAGPQLRRPAGRGGGGHLPQPQRAGARDEAERGQRVHGHSRPEAAREGNDVELPSDEDETADRQYEQARHSRDGPQGGHPPGVDARLREPRRGHSLFSLVRRPESAPRRMSHACTRARTCAGRNGFVR